MGALVEKCLMDVVKNLGLLIICVLPVAFSLLFCAVFGDIDEGHTMALFVFPTILIFATTMAPPTVALYTMALDREKGALRTLKLAGVSQGQVMLARGIAAVLITTVVVILCFLCSGEPVSWLVPLVIIGIAGTVVMTLSSLVPSVFARNQTDSSLYSVPILFMGLAPMFFQYSDALSQATAFLPTGGMFVLTQLLAEDKLWTPEAVLPAVLTLAWITVAAFVLAVVLRHAPHNG